MSSLFFLTCDQASLCFAAGSFPPGAYIIRQSLLTPAVSLPLSIGLFWQLKRILVAVAVVAAL